MQGDRSAGGEPPHPPSLFDRLRDRARGAMRPPEQRHMAWERTAAIVVIAAIGGCLVTGSVAFGAAIAVERRISAVERAAPAAAARLQDAAALAERFAHPGLDQRLAGLAKLVPEDARLMLVEDRRITLRTTDPDRLREQFRQGGGLGGYAEQGQRLAADGGIDVTLEERR